MVFVPHLWLDPFITLFVLEITYGQKNAVL